MKKMMLTMVLCLIGFSGSAQNLIQPYQIRMDTNSFPVMTLAGCTNLQQAFKFMDANWHTKGGYGTTNWVNGWTNNFTGLSNLVNGALDAMTNIATGIQTNSLLASNAVYFAAINSAATPTADESSTRIPFASELADTRTVYDGVDTFTAPTTGVYMVSATVRQTHATTGANTGRSILEVWKNASGSAYMILDRKNNYNEGVETVLAGSAVIALSASDYLRIYVTQDGYAATNVNGNCFFSVQQLR